MCDARVDLAVLAGCLSELALAMMEAAHYERIELSCKHRAFDIAETANYIGLQGYGQQCQQSSTRER